MMRTASATNKRVSRQWVWKHCVSWVLAAKCRSAKQAPLHSRRTQQRRHAASVSTRPA
jgi:hypothetical protein